MRIISYIWHNFRDCNEPCQSEEIVIFRASTKILLSLEIDGANANRTTSDCERDVAKRSRASSTAG